jgi:hypothetical protein
MKIQLQTLKQIVLDKAREDVPKIMTKKYFNLKSKIIE